jgi:hypothetical protein
MAHTRNYNFKVIIDSHLLVITDSQLRFVLVILLYGNYISKLDYYS